MSGGQHGRMVEARLRCGSCGNVAHIWRRAGRQKQAGHVKHMWCAVCRERTAHYEMRE